MNDKEIKMLTASRDNLYRQVTNLIFTTFAPYLGDELDVDDEYGETSRGLIIDCDDGALEVPDAWVVEWASVYAGGRSELIVREIRSCIQWLHDKNITQKKKGARARLGNWLRKADEMGRFKSEDDDRPEYPMIGGLGE